MVFGISLPSARSLRCSEGRPDASPVWCVGCIVRCATRRLLPAEEFRVELYELPWHSSLKDSGRSRVRPSPFGWDHAVCSLCVRHLETPRPLFSVFASNLPRIKYTRTPFKHESDTISLQKFLPLPPHTPRKGRHARGPLRAACVARDCVRGAAAGVLLGVCVLLSAVNFDTLINGHVDRDAAGAHGARARQRLDFRVVCPAIEG